MKIDVLIIGSSVAGLVAATTGKKAYPDKNFLLISKQTKTMVTCAIPYVFGELGSTDNNVVPVHRVLEKINSNIIHSEVVAINREEKSVEILSGTIIYYDRLVIATGSSTIKPTWLKGRDLDNVFYVPKEKLYIDSMQEKLRNLHNIVIVGAGFIGVEMAEELKKAGKNITLIEKESNILHSAFDNNLTDVIKEIIIDEEINVLTSTIVNEIIGDNRVEGVRLNNNQLLNADAVILSMGYTPNSDLAINAGLTIRSNGSIAVDEYMRTEDKDIFAVGDCAEKRDFITGKQNYSMLSSIAATEGRIAGMNIFELTSIKSFSGTISIYSTTIGGMGIGVAGLTERKAHQEGYKIVTGEYWGRDKHPYNLEGSNVQYVKLIVSVDSGLILGASVYGGQSAGELVNMIGVVIQNRMSINSLLTLQIGSHPLLTDSPATYPLIMAAERAYYSNKV